MASNTADNQAEAAHGSYASYVIGFVLSLALSLVAYFLVAKQMLSSQSVVIWIIGLAVAQLLVQLTFFLHLGRESKPRWNLIVLLFALLVLLILVLGSLWIMNNLNYHVDSPQETNTYIIHDEGIKP